MLHSDGAQAYPAVVKSHFPGLHTKAVSHQDMEFTKKIPWFKKGHSTLGGTQCIDSTWNALDKFVAPNIPTKKDHAVNDRLLTYLWAGLFRMNHREENGFELLGEAFKEDTI